MAISLSKRGRVATARQVVEAHSTVKLRFSQSVKPPIAARAERRALPQGTVSTRGRPARRNGDDVDSTPSRSRHLDTVTSDRRVARASLETDTARNEALRRRLFPSF